MKWTVKFVTGLTESHINTEQLTVMKILSSAEQPGLQTVAI